MLPSRQPPLTGVYLNGYSIAQGHHIEYFPYIQRQDGGVAREQALLGTVEMFYTFGHGTRGEMTFVEITPLPILGRIRSLYEIEAIDRNRARLNHFTKANEPWGGDTTMIKLDAISYRVKVLPHFHDDNRLLALRMQPAR